MPTTRRDYMDEEMEMSSSPDPLNDTPTFHGFASVRPKSQTRRSTRPRQSLPMSGSSPKKQMFELDVGDTLSPQKIRVTVEASESDAEGFYTNYIGEEEQSPLNSHAPRRERTFTTTVPVKGLSDTESEAQTTATPKRKGRPRKSIGTPILSKKRSRAATPSRRATPRRKSFGEPGWEEPEDKTFSVGKSIEVPPRKRRSVSRIRKGSQQKSSSPTATNRAEQTPSTSANKRSRGRRKAVNAEDTANFDDHSNIFNPQQETEDNFVVPNPVSSPTPSKGLPAEINFLEMGQEDVVIARFDPGNETPQKPGWSSLDTSRQAEEEFVNHASVSPEPVSSRRSKGKSIESSIARSSRSHSVSSGGNIQYGGDGDSDGMVDGLDEDEDENANDRDQTREFDTIMESEEFSMISMDSLNHSTPWNRTQTHETPNPPRTKSLLSIQQSAGDNDVDAQNHGRETNEATPQPSHSPGLVPSSPKDALHDFDVSVPQDSRPLMSKVPPNHEPETQYDDDSLSTIPPEILEAASPVKDPPISTFVAATIKHDEAYEDSFSEIPQAILDAAAPRTAKTQTQTVFKVDNSSVAASTSINTPGSKSGLLSSLAIKSTSPRLLTPEETPSPPCESPMTKASTGGENRPTEPVDEKQSVNEAPTTCAQIRSSPPPRRYTYTAHLRQHHQLHADAAETPSIKFSSPQLPPPVPQTHEQVGCPEEFPEGRRPTLSPIAKAGRILQDALVPSSSSRSRSQSLGSPFKSPSANRNPSSVAREFQFSSLEERHEKALPKLCLTDNFAAFSNMEPRWSPSGRDDPFNSATRSHQSPSIEQKEQYTVEPSRRPVLSNPRFSSLRSQIGSVRSEDAMSWQAEAEIAISGNQASNPKSVPENPRSVTPEPTRTSPIRQISTPPREKAWAAERAAISKQIESAEDNQVLVINSDDDSKSPESDDEDFGLLLETMGTASSPFLQDHSDNPKTVTEKPRRSKLPSPWRKNSKRLVYSDELSHMSSPVVEKRPHIPGKIIGDIDVKPLTARRVLTSQVNNDYSQEDMDLSGWQIPQKSNFRPQTLERGNLTLSTLLASPPKRLPVLPTSSGGVSFQSSQNTTTSSLSNRRGREETPDPSNDSIEARLSFTPIPQKMGFTPRPRSRAENSQEPPATRFEVEKSTDSNGISNPGVLRLNPFARQKTNLPISSTPASDIPSSPDYMNDTNSSVTSTSEKENPRVENRNLKWTEAVGLVANSLQAPPSPTKSILRSPLKAPARGPGSIQNSPSKAVAWVSSPASSTGLHSPFYRPLSATEWTREHWQVLEYIVLKWKPENRQASPDVYGSVRRRHDTRVVSRLVGRSVSSLGKRMILQQWHLDAVDEFRFKVPGWQEKAIALRVFSLIVAEENRRARTLVEETMAAQRSTEV
ncbi:hypothetical protein HYALB_00000884 [Hymenoscyphus albidus]|uniref:Uncharacterized protein n=1 Tax=Hymenoscyphus albidus TaxID=595503 RepID=A0A9N9PWQ7_9HELO|nr:hypothetical protein HYALB_00000884 [Hymenoscyphus albidus]